MCDWIFALLQKKFLLFESINPNSGEKISGYFLTFFPSAFSIISLKVKALQGNYNTMVGFRAGTSIGGSVK
jgi:hypothetical protein